MAIYTILLSNFKKRKGSFISIFILVLIVSMTVSTILSAIISGKERFAVANNEANSPNIINTVLKDMHNSDMKNKLEETQEVKYVEESEFISYLNLKIGDKKYANDIFLSSYEPKQHSYKLESNNNRMNLPKEGEIYLPSYFKDEFDCKVGMEITLQTEEGDYIYKITDFFEDPVYGSRNIGIKRFFMNQNDFSQLSKLKVKEFKNLIQINTFISDSYKDKDINKAIYNLNQKTGIEKYGEICFNLGTFEKYTFLLTNIITAILLGFCVLLFIIVIIVIGYSINSNIEMDYVSLGILKSIGFNNRQIRLILLLQYILTSILGGGIGLLLSTFLVKPVGGLLLTSTGLFLSGNIQIIACLGILGALLLLLSLFIIVITRKITKVSPVRAITFGHAPVYFSSRINFSLDKASFIPLSIKISGKQIITHLKQYVMLFIVVGILTFFTISIALMRNMITGDNVGNIFNYASSDISISYTNKEDLLVVNEIIKEIESEDNVKGKFKLEGNYKSVEDSKKLVIIVEDLGGVLNQPLQGRNPKYSNEVVITTVMSDLLQKSIGDTIVVENSKGNKADYIIVGLNQNSNDVGKNITMLEDGMRILEPEFTLKRTEFQIEDREKSNSIVEKLKEKYKKYEDVIIITDTYKLEKESMESITNTINSATTGVYIIAIIVVGLISILVCSNTLQKEKIDIGILKAQGFTTKQLRGQFTLRFLIVALVGSGLGIILNIMCNDYIMSLIFKNIGLSNFATVYSIKTLMEPVAIICIFTCLFAWLVTMKIKKVTPKNLIQE